MWKPVKLQGYGAGVVTLNARQSPTEKLLNARNKIKWLIDNNMISLLDGQNVNTVFQALGAGQLATEEGAGILVAGLAGNGSGTFGYQRN